MSEVWKYFVVCRDDHSKAECKKCGKKVSRGRNPSSYTTSTMKKHLASCHDVCIKSAASAKRHSEDVATGSGTGTCSQVMSQPTVTELFAKRKKFDTSSSTARDITVKIAEMIAADFMPYSVVQNIGFKRLIKTLEPRYTLPSRKHISNTVLSDIYKKMVVSIGCELRNAAGPICATTDIWSDQQNNSYMSVTANFLVWNKGELDRRTPVLSCKELSGSHTAEMILSELRNQEEAWHIKFGAVVSDNAPNVTKALVDGGIVNIRCMAHTINLIVTHALRSHRASSDTITVARSIVGHYHRSNRDAEKFKECQRSLNAPEHKLIQDVATRWNSTYYMLERLIEQKETVNHLSIHDLTTTAALTNNQWKIALSLTKVLKPFEIATREMCCESATISNILPMKHNLLQILDDFSSDENIYGIRSLIDELKSQMETRFRVPTTDVPQPREAYFQTVDIYNRCFAAAVFDPRLRSTWCPELTQSDIEEILISEIRNFPNVERTEEQIEAGQSSSSEDAEESIIFGASEKQRKEDAGSADTDSEIITHVRKYLAEGTIRRTKSPLQFWSKYSSDCPVMLNLAISLLSCPPTSFNSERLFSSAGLVSTPLRNRLKPKNVEMLTVLHVNLKKMNFQY